MDLVSEVVLTIHGVQSRGEWQLRVAPELSGIDGLVYDPHVYGRFAFWKVLIAPLRKREVRKFYTKISECQERFPAVAPSIIAHSFGTYIVSQALKTFPSIKVNRVIFCGSIVDRDYDWATLVNNGRVLKIRNEVAGRDRVVALFQWRVMRALVPETGASGTCRFNTSLAEVEQQEFHGYEHSSHFIANSHCRCYWVPFLRGTLDFRDLCAICTDENDPKRGQAFAAFCALYDPPLRTIVHMTFPNRSEEQLSDILKLLRREVIVHGAMGTRKFDELAYRFAVALRRHVS